MTIRPGTLVTFGMAIGTGTVVREHFCLPDLPGRLIYFTLERMSRVSLV